MDIYNAVRHVGEETQAASSASEQEVTDATPYNVTLCHAVKTQNLARQSDQDTPRVHNAALNVWSITSHTQPRLHKCLCLRTPV